MPLGIEQEKGMGTGVCTVGAVETKAIYPTSVCLKAACCLGLLTKLDGTSNCENYYTFQEIQSRIYLSYLWCSACDGESRPIHCHCTGKCHIWPVDQTWIDCFHSSGGTAKTDGMITEEQRLQTNGHLLACILFKRVMWCWCLISFKKEVVEHVGAKL